MAAPARSELTVLAAWEAAVVVTARLYKLKPSELGAVRAGEDPTRARTQRRCWEARKVATIIAVVVADCTYAALARAIGLHRDTVTAHCAQFHAMCEVDPLLEHRAEVLERYARAEMLSRMEGERAKIERDLADGLAVKLDRLPLRRPTTRPTEKGGVFSGHENLMPLPMPSLVARP